MTGVLVADTSAILAAAFAERQRDAVLAALAKADGVLLSSSCLLEGSIVAQSRLGGEGQAEMRLLLEAFAVEIVPFTAEQAVIASDAWRRFGKGRHPAGLNIIDCCSYALSTQAGAPLLAVGSDFTRTDLDLVSLRL